jgi:hypothetical protein
MKLALEQQQIARFADLLLNSLAADAEEYVPKPTEVSPPLNPAAVLASIHLLDTCNTFEHRKKLEEIKAEHQRIYVEKILQPLFELATTLPDPLDRAAHFQIAKLHALFDQNMFAVREHQGSDATHRGDKSISELLAISAQLIALLKELDKCKTQRRKSTGTGGLPMSIFPRFAASDLTNNN